MTAVVMKAYRMDRGPGFYEMALRCAHSLWLQGLPAQSLLLMNRSMSADLAGSEEVLKFWPMPYQAKAWIMQRRQSHQFIGNPRRHYQHLATRMSGPRSELRTWRAWASWLMACRIFPDYPADEEQIRLEGIQEPTQEEIEQKLGALGLPGEVEWWKLALQESAPFSLGISGKPLDSEPI